MEDTLIEVVMVMVVVVYHVCEADVEVRHVVTTGG